MLFCPFVFVIAIYVLTMKGIWILIGDHIPKFNLSRKQQFYLIDLLIAVFVYGFFLTVWHCSREPDALIYYEQFIPWAIFYLFCTVTGFLFSCDVRVFMKNDATFYPVFILTLLLFPLLFLLVIPLWLQWRGWFR